MPVLPDDGSRIVAPGVSTPSRSASSIILSAMRSFDEPPGFWPSSLAQILHVGVRRELVHPDERRVADQPEDVVVLRHASRAAGDRGEDREHVAVGELGVEAVEVADVVVVLVDVHELVQAARVVEQVVAQARVALDERA